MALIASRPVETGAARIPSAHLAVPNALVAAGQLITSETKSNGGVSQGQSGWQNDGWNFFDTVGELQFVCNWLSNALSRCTIMASDVNPDTGQPTGETDDDMANNTTRDIAGGPAGQAILFGKMATFFTVPGEMYMAIIYREKNDAKGSLVTNEEWHILATDEVKRGSTKTELMLPDGTKHEVNDETDTLQRVYMPHPRKATEANSPVRACIPILREMVRLGQYVEATAKSRLAGNGVVLLPQELSMPVVNAPVGQTIGSGDTDAPGLPSPTPPPASTGTGVQPTYSTRSVNANDVMQALVTAGATAVQDPGSAAALVPIVLQAPGEFLDKIKHLTFGTTFTDTVMKLREAATRRLALSLDVPAEILLGVGDMNHWSSWQVEESAIKLHVEPLMVRICDALTEFILRPMLELQGHPDPESVVIWYDTTGLAMRPNRSEDAKAAFDRGQLSPEAFIDYLGFQSGDGLDLTNPEHRKSFVIQMVLKNPALLSEPSIAAELGMEPTTPPVQAAPPADTSGTGQPENDTEPSTTDTKSPPDVDEEADTATAARNQNIAGATALAMTGLQRALELAGKRLRTRGNLAQCSDQPIHATHIALRKRVNDERVLTLINGWSSTLTPQVLDRYSVDRARLTLMVEGKAREALTQCRTLESIEFGVDEVSRVLKRRSVGPTLRAVGGR